MKYFYLFFLLLVNDLANAQIEIQNLYKTWVLTKSTYTDGTELPLNHPLKFTYQRYTFLKSGKYRLSLSYEYSDNEKPFQLNKGILSLKTKEGFVMNRLKMKTLSDTLALIQAGEMGFEDSSALILKFVPEEVYQASHPVGIGDIYQINGGDTTYFGSHKVYPIYKGGSLESKLYDRIGEYINMNNRNAFLIASFFVLKNGIADSVHILKGVDPAFNNLFIRLFNEEKKNWKAATLRGKNVNTLMKVFIRYSSSNSVPAYFLRQKGWNAFQNGNFKMALSFYEESLAIDPYYSQSFLNRGLCKLILGDKTGACEDWQNAKNTGSLVAPDLLLEKYCTN